MKILICGVDIRFLIDENGIAYTSEERGWWGRFSDLKGDITVLGVASKIKNQDKTNLVRIDSFIDNARIVCLPKAQKATEYFSCLKKIKKIIDTEMKMADATIIRYQGASVYMACKLARKYNVKQLVELGGDPWDAFWNHSIYGKILAIPMTLLCKKDVKKAEYVHYVTEKYLQERYPTKGVSIGLSNVILQEFSNDRLEARVEKIKTHSGKVIIGTAAAVNVRYKGQQYMIEALSILKERGYTDFEYQIAGKGSNAYLKSVADQFGVSDQVKFMGALPHDEVFKWLDSLDIYIQPSLQEGLPRAMIEAMSRGLPCIGAKTAGIPELISSKYIYERKDMPNKIVNLITNLQSKDKMMNEARKNYEVSKKFQLSNITEKRTEFYRQFLEG